MSRVVFINNHASYMKTKQRSPVALRSPGLSYAATAALFGIGFALAVGSVSAEAPLAKREASNTSEATTRIEQTLEEDGREVSALLVGDSNADGRVAPSNRVLAQVRNSAQKMHQEDMEAILVEGDYLQWIEYIQHHPLIADVISSVDIDNRLIRDARTGAENRDELGLPVGEAWVTAV